MTCELFNDHIMLNSLLLSDYRSSVKQSRVWPGLYRSLLEMDRMSDYDIRPKPKVWLGSPNECRTFGRTSAECCTLDERLLLVTGECTEQPENVVVTLT